MTEEMDLVTAFRLLGPCVEPKTDAACEAAARRVMQEIERVSAGLYWVNPEDRKDAGGAALLELVRRGPRGNRPNDPRTDAEVRAFLFVVLRRKAIDLYRKRRREVSVDDIDQPFRDLHSSQAAGRTRGMSATGDEKDLSDPAGDPELGAELERLREELKEAERQLREQIVPRLTERMRSGSGDALRATFAEFDAVKAGQVVVNDIVRRENPALTPGKSKAWRKARNNVDARFKKAIERIVREIQELDERGEIGWIRYLALLQVTNGLRVRARE